MNWYETVKKPLPWAEVEVKVQSLSGDKSKGLAVCYADARAVRRRLDDAFGPENWRTSYTDIHGENNKFVGARVRFEADLPGGKTLVREEAGAATAVEPIKGAYSDALKRVFASLGHDCLYEVTLGWHPVTDKKWAPFTDQVLNTMKRIYEQAVRELASETAPRVEMSEEEPERPPAPSNGRGAAGVAAKLGLFVVFGNGADRYLANVGMAEQEAKDWQSAGIKFDDIVAAKMAGVATLEAVRERFESVSKGVSL